MRNEFEDAFKTSMNTLRFSPEDKKRITEKIIQTHTEQRRINMNKWTLPKAAAIAATCLLVTGGTVFAASKIIMYTASSNANYDYSSATEMNSATPDRQENAEVKMPDFPDSLGGYSFDGGNTVYVAGKDDSGNTLGKWDDLSAVYKNEDGDIVNLTLSYNLSDDENRTPTESRTIEGITVNFNYDEYLILPNENEPLEASVQERKENDDHFFVSYGGEKETYFFSNASFIKDGVRYLIFTNDDVSADDLFKMAAELLKNSKHIAKGAKWIRPLSLTHNHPYPKTFGLSGLVQDQFYHRLSIFLIDELIFPPQPGFPLYSKTFLLYHLKMPHGLLIQPHQMSSVHLQFHFQFSLL